MLTFVLKFLTKKQQLYLALTYILHLSSVFLKTMENSNFQVYAKIPGFLLE